MKKEKGNYLHRGNINYLEFIFMQITIFQVLSNLVESIQINQGIFQCSKIIKQEVKQNKTRAQIQQEIGAWEHMTSGTFPPLNPLLKNTHDHLYCRMCVHLYQSKILLYQLMYWWYVISLVSLWNIIFANYFLISHQLWEWKQWFPHKISTFNGTVPFLWKHCKGWHSQFLF